LIRFVKSIQSFTIKAGAFIKRDFLIEASYSLAFILEFFGVLATILTFYFIAKFIGKGANLYLQDYGTEYFPFVLIGIAFKDYFTSALENYSKIIRIEQMTGTLEAMFVTPTKISTIILSMGLWNIIRTSVFILVYLLIGIFFLGIDLTNMNFWATSIILILTVVSFSSVSIISASFVMVFKRGDPISFATGKLFVFLGGVFFPITILPQGLQTISHFLPITYALRAMRYALLQGYSVKMLTSDIIVLLIFSLVLLPLSIFIFNYAVKKAKNDGTLTYY